MPAVVGKCTPANWCVPITPTPPPWSTASSHPAARGRAVFAHAQPATSATERPAPIRLPGLNPDADYRVEAIPGVVSGPVDRWPAWTAGDVRLTGRALAVIGLPAPPLHDRPGTAFLLEAIRVG